MKVFVIHNPAAGQRDKTDELSQMVDYFHRIGWEVAGIEHTRGRGDATTYARQAVALGCDVLFVAGGDGTVSQAVDGLVGSSTALAVLPSGTGNVMARQLGLPTLGSLRPHTLTDFAQLLVEGQMRWVDVGRIKLAGGQLAHHFLCWAGVGFDAAVNLTVNEEPERKHRLGMMAFVVAALITMRDYAGTGAIVRLDGRRVSRRLLMLVANNIQLYGVFLKMAPRAILDDGLLDIYCFRGSGTWRTILHGVRLLLNAHPQDPEVDIYQARQVEIKTARPLPVHIDGEPIGYTPVVIDVLERSIRMLVPPGAPASLFVHAGEEETARGSRPGSLDGGPTGQAVLGERNDLS